MDLNSPEFKALCTKISKLSPEQTQKMSDEAEAAYPDGAKQKAVVERYIK